MSFKVDLMGDQAVYRFPSKLETLYCKEIEEELLAQIERHQGPIVFDLAGVEFISSYFLKLMVQTSKKTGPGRLTLTKVSPMIKKTLKTAGFDALIKNG